MDPDKVRTMVRRILPSTYHRSARAAKRQECRKVRRVTRCEIRTVDAEWLTDARLDRQPNQRETVIWRRTGDKLHPFMRWCDAHTRHMSDEAAIDYVRALVPRNLIGEHALSHWRSYVTYSRNRGRRSWNEAARREQQSWFDRTCLRLRRLLMEAPEFHGELNRTLKRAAACTALAAASRGPAVHRGRGLVRLLRGRHDVEAFVRDVERSKDPGSAALLDQLLDQGELAVKRAAPMELQIGNLH